MSVNSQGDNSHEEEELEKEAAEAPLPVSSFVRWFGPVRVESRQKFRWYGPVRVVVTNQVVS